MNTPVLMVLAAALLALNVFLLMTKGVGGLQGPTLIGFIVGQVVLFPLAVVGIAGIWRKNRTAVRALSVFSIVSVVLTISLAVRVIAVLSEPPKEVTGRFGQVRIAVPSSWVAFPGMGPSEAIHMVSQSGNENFAVIPEERSVETGSVQQLAKRAADRIAASPSLRESRGPLSCVVDSLPCAQYEMDLEISGTDVTMQYSVVEGKKSFYHLLATTGTSLFSSNKAKFSKILASFEELP